MRYSWYGNEFCCMGVVTDCSTYDSGSSWTNNWPWRSKSGSNTSNRSRTWIKSRN